MNLKNKRKNLSIPDAIGYTIAKNKAKLSAGNEDFKDFDNVEFAKK